MATSAVAMGNRASSDIQVHQAPTELTLGGLFPLSGTLAGGGVERDAAARMAVKEINENTQLLPDTTLKISVKDTATDPSTGSQVASELISDGVVGLIGAASSSVSTAIASGPSLTNKVPQISYSSTSPDLSNKTLYPYFLRVVPPDSIQGLAIANLVDEWNFTSVATLATSDDYGLGGIGVFESEATDLGIDVVSSQRFAQGATDIKAQLQSIVDSDVKQIVLNVIVGDAITVFSQAADLGMTAENGYTWIGTDGPTQGAVFENNTKIQNAMQGMVGTRPNTGSDAVYNSFLDLWETCYGADENTYAGCGDRTPNTYATFAYDAVYTFANAFQKMIDNDEADQISNGTRLLEVLYDTDFTGATGVVKFNENGDRLGVYDVINLVKDQFKVVGTWDTTNGYVETGTIDWDGELVTGQSGAPGFGFYLAVFTLIVTAPAIRRFRKKDL